MRIADNPAPIRTIRVGTPETEVTYTVNQAHNPLGITEIYPYWEIEGEGSHLWFRLKKGNTIVAVINSSMVYAIEY